MQARRVFLRESLLVSLSRKELFGSVRKENVFSCFSGVVESPGLYWGLEGDCSDHCGLSRSHFSYCYSGCSNDFLGSFLLVSLPRSSDILPVRLVGKGDDSGGTKQVS